VRRLRTVSAVQLDELANVLIDCVEGGASVSFLLPFGRDKARAFWAPVAGAVANGERALLVAEDSEGIVGTAQLLLAQPPNQPHRADVAKLLVHRRARRQGVAAALMRATEAAARDCGRSLLVLERSIPSARYPALCTQRSVPSALHLFSTPAFLRA
jgi:GNAT superfamily N-acetyltransferase